MIERMQSGVAPRYFPVESAHAYTFRWNVDLQIFHASRIGSLRLSVTFPGVLRGSGPHVSVGIALLGGASGGGPQPSAIRPGLVGHLSASSRTPSPSLSPT